MKEKLEDIKKLLGELSDAQLLDMVTRQRALVNEVREDLRSQIEHLRFLEAVFQARHAIRKGDPIVRISGPFDTGVTVIPNEFANMSAVDAIREVLHRKAGSLHVDEIVHLLRQGGFPFRASFPDASIEVALKREKDKFERVKPHVYKLKDRVNKTQKEKDSDGDS